jgi:SAM-dependent methyltransferase
LVVASKLEHSREHNYLTEIKVKGKVTYLSKPVENGFEEAYLRIRDKEHRLLDDTTVAMLPRIPAAHPLHREWKARAASFERLRKYLYKVKQHVELLDVGCGNGWAAAALAATVDLNVSALDVNVAELEQAARIFRKPNLQFYYGDVFEDIFPEKSFDYIVLNASAQYFPDLRGLIERLFYFLKDIGEIHIIDTPLYADDEVEAARKRTLEYYTSMGCPELSGHYFHHTFSIIKGFRFEVLSGGGLLKKLISLLQASVPVNFTWVRIMK